MLTLAQYHEVANHSIEIGKVSRLDPRMAHLNKRTPDVTLEMSFQTEMSIWEFEHAHFSMKLKFC